MHLRTATFSGDVRIESSGTQPLQGNAGRVVLNFTGTNVLSTVHSEQNVRLSTASEAGHGIRERTGC